MQLINTEIFSTEFDFFFKNLKCKKSKCPSQFEIQLKQIQKVKTPIVEYRKNLIKKCTEILGGIYLLYIKIL